jgi:ADP-heptose:LPS heptosyltransferase
MRILYAAGGGIGNVVMATPAIAALASMRHDVWVFLEPDVPDGVAQLLRGWQAVKGVLGEPAPLPVCDCCIHSVWSRSKLGYRHEYWSHGVDLKVTHETEANMKPVRRFAYAGPTPEPHVEAGHRLAGVEPGSYRAIATGCKTDPYWDRKRWHGWHTFITALGGIQVFLGTKEESRDWMSFGLRKDLCGRTKLIDAAGWIAGAKSVIAIDNGLAHMAAALGVPTVVLFGATSKVKNRPLGPKVETVTLATGCRPCQMTPEWDACRDWKCMDFDPAIVARVIRDMEGRERGAG